MNALRRFLPFLAWFPPRPGQLRADFIAGLTVALVLIPQSMAYAQLAGLPPYYGLYAAFLPVMVAAMWGSSAQLGTGPVAVVSLLTASALTPLAAVGSAEFVALAILLSLMVAAIQLGLGVFRLGVVVNFLSHPVIVGFTNAAAIIIALSQLNKLFGVPMGNTGNFLVDIWAVLLELPDTHLPTLAMGVGALALMAVLRRQAPKAPGVLIAVVVATGISWSIGFERQATVPFTAVANERVRGLLDESQRLDRRLAEIGAQAVDKARALAQAERTHGPSHLTAALHHEHELLKLEQNALKQARRDLLRELRKLRFERVSIGDADAGDRYFPVGERPTGASGNGTQWKIRAVGSGELRLNGGGDVVGAIPAGLPSPKLPEIDFDKLRALLSSALVIALVGFMEAISIAKALAAKSQQRIDPNQELLGQGLANLAGALTQSFPASGSFSRSAVNFSAGARTGFSSVVTGLIVMLVLLFLTPLLYHLPQAVLAAIIIMAVIGLVNFGAMHHAWQASRHDGIAAGVTFAATLAFAPHLDNGIMVGAGLAILLYLFRTMRPRIAILGRHPDGTLRDVAVFPELAQSPDVIALRFDGRLYFANVPYFEDAVLEAAAAKPGARALLIVGDAMNELDASGEEVLRNVVVRLRENGVGVLFSGLKKQVLDVMAATGLDREIGAENFFRTEDAALDAIAAALGEEAVACLRPGTPPLAEMAALAAAPTRARRA